MEPKQLNRRGLSNVATRPFGTRPDADPGEFRIAGFNLQTAFVTDSEKNAAKYPQYCWNRRAQPLVDLIVADSPAVLAICEFNMEQAGFLRTCLPGYILIGFASETGASIEEVDSQIANAQTRRHVKDPYYGEFVGFLVASDVFDVVEGETKCHVLPKGARHGRILVEVGLVHRASHTRIAAFSSHFDHLSEDSRRRSATVELDLIADRKKHGQPCITFGDRNFFPDAGGQQCYELYVNSGLVADVRDSEHGHYGPPGTFPGHLGLPERFAPRIVRDEHGREVIDANTLDVGFVTKEFVVKNSYSYFGAFAPDSGKLRPNDAPGDLHTKPFVSDHYYIGATVALVSRR